jgi:hypothetical protein|tara:strand:+ start:990 stop:1943 length:954 start_codon:yes stop_codon:yes gene_type:complete
MGFAKSEHVERWLTSVRANFKYRDTIQISKLIPGWADKNPCRAGKAIIDESMSYAERMAGGEQAPPAIVVKDAEGYELLDGRQRVFAATTNGESVFAAYELLNPSPQLRALVGLGANAALNGVRPAQAYLIDQAIRYKRDFDCTIQEAARIAGVAVATMDSHLNTIIVRDELRHLGIEPQMSNGTLAALRPFLGQKQVLKETYQALENTEATVSMAERLVSDMRSNPGEGHRIKVLDGWLSRPEIIDRLSRKRGRKMSDKQALFQSVRALKTVLKERYDSIQSEMKPVDKQELAKLAEYVTGKCRYLCGEYMASAVH